MKLFTSNKELQERIDSLEADLSAMTEQSAALTEKDREIAELRAGFDTERAEMQAALDSATDMAVQAKIDLEAMTLANAELKEQVEFTQEKVSLEAARQLAAAGHPPVEGVSGEQDKPDPYAGKSKQELESIAHNMRNDPKAQSAFVTKYLRPLIGQ